MKKHLLFLFLLPLLLLVGCAKDNLENISVSELKEKMQKKESFIVYFASKDDEILEQTLNNTLTENNITAYRIDIDDIKDQEKKELQIKIPYTDPSIVFIIDGKDPSKLTHVTNDSITVKQLTERLKDLNLLNAQNLS